MAREENVVRYLDGVNSRQMVSVVSWVIVTALLVIAVVYATYFGQFHGKLETDQEKWGQFGDFIGGTLNPLLSFLTLIALIFTVVLQTRQLEHSREELANSREELRETRAEMARSTEMQKELALAAREQAHHASEQAKYASEQARFASMTTRLTALTAALTAANAELESAKKMSGPGAVDRYRLIEKYRDGVMMQIDAVYKDIMGRSMAESSDL